MGGRQFVLVEPLAARRLRVRIEAGDAMRDALLCITVGDARPADRTWMQRRPPVRSFNIVLAVVAEIGLLASDRRLRTRRKRRRADDGEQYPAQGCRRNPGIFGTCKARHDAPSEWPRVSAGNEGRTLSEQKRA